MALVEKWSIKYAPESYTTILYPNKAAFPCHYLKNGLHDVIFIISAFLKTKHLVNYMKNIVTRLISDFNQQCAIHIQLTSILFRFLFHQRNISDLYWMYFINSHTQTVNCHFINIHISGRLNITAISSTLK